MRVHPDDPEKLFFFVAVSHYLIMSLFHFITIDHSINKDFVDVDKMSLLRSKQFV